MMPVKFERTYESVQDDVAAGINWESFAECATAAPHLFAPPAHPERKAELSARETAAKAICAACFVREQCLEASLTDYDTMDSTIRGGLNKLERKRLRKKLQN